MTCKTSQTLFEFSTVQEECFYSYSSFNFSAESKGRRFSKRLAEKRLRALQQENVPPPPTPPPLPPPPPQTPQMGATLTVSVFVCMDFTLQQSLVPLFI